MEGWSRSEPYQAIARAVRENEPVRVARIIETSLAAAMGVDRAFWLLARCGQRSVVATRNAHAIDLAWEDLEEAFRLGIDDARIRESVLFTAISLCISTEKLDRMMRILRALRQDFRQLTDRTFVRYNLGVLHLKRGRWRAAHRSLSRALWGMLAMAPEEKAAFESTMALLYARRGLAALACGAPDQAEQDVASADELTGATPNPGDGYLVLALTRAELAFARGSISQARAELQLGLVRDEGQPCTKSAPWDRVDAELLAARLARAEGNEPGFEYFCRRALALAVQHQLCISEARVRAVMAGAVR